MSQGGLTSRLVLVTFVNNVTLSVPSVALPSGVVLFSPLREILREGAKSGCGESSIMCLPHELQAQGRPLTPYENAQVWGVPFGLSTRWWGEMGRLTLISELQPVRDCIPKRWVGFPRMTLEATICRSTFTSSQYMNIHMNKHTSKR